MSTERVALPGILRAFNRAGDVLDRLGSRRRNVDVDGLLATARKRTGLSDFGDDDGWRDGLRTLLDAVRKESQLSMLGSVLFREQLLRSLITRLEVVDAWTRTPEILEQEVSPILAIVALPRTGTSLLHSLLALDPRTRTPRTWELMFPCPPPRSETFDEDPRIAKTARISSVLDRINRHNRIHPMVAHGPDECFFLLASTFACFSYDGPVTVPSYIEWLLRQDRRFAYAWHRKVLQLLQWRCKRDRWVLKSPLHLFSLDTFLATYPNARIIQTHRDPVEIAGSCCSLYESGRQMYCKPAPPESIGRRWLDLWTEGFERGNQVLAHLPREQVFDVQYERLLAEPVDEVARIYAHFDLELPEEMPRRIRDWLADNPKDKRGVHAYDLGRYGLLPQDVFDALQRPSNAVPAIDPR